MRHAFCIVGSATPKFLGDLELLFCKFRMGRVSWAVDRGFTNYQSNDRATTFPVEGRPLGLGQ